MFTTVSFWVALGSIILTNIILSGDNAVVIALASRNLQPQQQRKAIFWGSLTAIVFRVVLTLTAVTLLTLPYLKIVGSILLIYIGIQLLNDNEKDEQEPARDNLWGAIRTILIADLIMSLDNVVAVAAAAQKGPEEARIVLLLLGLGLSIPIIVLGSSALLRVMNRFPIIIILGASLLGYLAGEMFVSDFVIQENITQLTVMPTYLFGLLGVILVMGLGYLFKNKSPKAST